MNHVKPAINVTPLIDVLLVLLIIFMVISPAKPTDFKTKIPQPPKNDNAGAHPETLIVVLNRDASLKLNNEADFGSADETEKLVQKLAGIFQKRTENHDYSAEAELNTNLTEDEKIEKTVFIKAPRAIDYGRVAKVIDAVKTAGANPISLQIDDLD